MTREYWLQTEVRRVENVSQFAGKKYLCIETYRRNRLPVQTPVWFLEKDGLLYFHTDHRTGKIRRIRANSKVRVVPCSARGRPEGVWVEGDARFVEDSEQDRVKSMIVKKYGVAGKIGRFYQWITGRKEIAIAVSIHGSSESEPVPGVVHGKAFARLEA